MSGEELTRWTVRISLLCYFLAIVLRLASHRAATHQAARIIFTLGCIIFLAHVAAAFHFFHDWSHADAYDATRRESRDVAGFDSGIGLWLNYLFTALWLCETVTWWRGNDRYGRRPRWRHATVHGFMLFMIFNATVVFEAGAVRWFGLAGCLLVIALAIRAVRRHKLVTK